jgi:hypothetical protein
MKYIITLLALFLLAGGTVNAQTNTNTPALVVQWAALKSAQGANFSPTSAEAVAIKDAILAQDQISKNETYIVQHVLMDGTGDWNDEARAVVRANASKSPMFAARVKFWDKDPTGWTQEMIEESAGLAYGTASLPTASPEFKAQVWEVAKNERGGATKFFKTYRSTLPKAEQIAATEQQKAIMLAITQRSEKQNAWLAEISADLIALSLDQKQ